MLAAAMPVNRRRWKVVNLQEHGLIFEIASECKIVIKLCLNIWPLYSRWMHRGKVWYNIPVRILIKYSYIFFNWWSHDRHLENFSHFPIRDYISWVYFIIHRIWTDWITFGSALFILWMTFMLMAYFFCNETLFRFVNNNRLIPWFRQTWTVD